MCVLEITIGCSTAGITRCSGREQWVWSGGDHWVQSSEKLKLWLTGDQSQVCVLEGNSGCGPVGITKCDLSRLVGVVLLWCGD